MRRLLIFSADYTGHGHKSIADSITERLGRFKDIEVKVVDGFDLMNRVQQICAEKTYTPVTLLPGAWAMAYAAGAKLVQPLQKMVAWAMRAKFEKLIDEYRPDCIMSVHPMFIGSILDLLEELKLNIPFIAHQADLIDIAMFWFDPRITLSLCPSKEALECSVAHGMDRARLKQVAFPVRSRFMGLAEKAAQHKNDRLTVTVMSGSEGAGTVKHVARALLKGTDAKVNVICGRNDVLRKKLRHRLGKYYHGRLNAMGFVSDIQNVMLESDILVLRASPNSVMEGIALNKPIILFGQLAGQELHNPQMLLSYGVAAYCPEADDLPKCIRELTKDNGAAIERMRRCQREFAPDDGTMRTAEFLNEFIKPYGWQ